MTPNYESVLNTPDYKLLTEAHMLCKYRIESLETIIDDTTNNAKPKEYNAAYNQLLHAFQYLLNLREGDEDAKEASKAQTWMASTSVTRHPDTLPAEGDLSVKDRTSYDSAIHLLALKSASSFLERTLFTIEHEIAKREKDNDPLDLIASKELSSMALLQMMFRFAECHEDADGRCERAWECHQTAGDSVGRERAVEEMDEGTVRGGQWSAIIERIAAMLAERVQTEEHERRTPRIELGPAAGDYDDFEDGSEDEDTDQGTDRALPEEGADDENDESPSQEDAEEPLLHDEADDTGTPGDEEKSDFDAEDLNIGKMRLVGSAPRTATDECAEGKKESGEKKMTEEEQTERMEEKESPARQGREHLGCDDDSNKEESEEKEKAASA